MASTYRDLQEMLSKFTTKQLDQNITVYVSGVDEFYTLVDDYPFGTADEDDDRLDAGHAYLRI